MIKRRTFVKTGTISVLGVAAFGSVHWNGKSYTTGNPTTTDILGPFYRPGAPVRTNLVPEGSKGTPLKLTGTVFEDDGKTPLPEVTIEAWQCDENQHYDNTSDEYLFRGTTKTGKDGKYEFQTIIPVPYKATPNLWRPAHIHLLISSPSHQDLITQIYFKGDPHLDEDTSSTSPTAANRILDISEIKGTKIVEFDIVMAETFPLDDSVFQKLSGLYDLDQGMAEFYRQDDLLMVKRNGQISEGLVYKGNNTFEGAMGLSKVSFELRDDGGTIVTITTANFNDASKSRIIKGTKILKYG